MNNATRHEFAYKKEFHDTAGQTSENGLRWRLGVVSGEDGRNKSRREKKEKWMPVIRKVTGWGGG